MAKATVEVPEFGSGFLEISEKGFGFLRSEEHRFQPKPTDIFVTPDTIKKRFLREGCFVYGSLQPPHRGNNPQLKEVLRINDLPYEDFIKGAKDGFHTVAAIMPTLIGLMMAVGILRSSGFLEFFGGLLGQLTDPLGLPAPVVPVIIVKLFSSSAATGLVLDIFKNYGTDSRVGLMTSILMSCTETCFYTMSVYYMAAKVTKTRYTLAGALLATAAGVVMSVVMTGLMLQG